MAGDSKVDNRLCFYCKNKCVLKAIKCENCTAWFHKSCSIKCTKKCCQNQFFGSDKQNKNSDLIVLDKELDEADLKLINESLKFENKILFDMNKDQKEHIDMLKAKIESLQEQKLFLESQLHEAMNQGKPDWNNMQKVIREEIENVINDQYNKINVKLEEIQQYIGKKSKNTSQKNDPPKQKQTSLALEVVEKTTDLATTVDLSIEKNCEVSHHIAEHAVKKRKDSKGHVSLHLSDDNLTSNLKQKQRNDKNKTNSPIKLQNVKNAVLQAQTQIKMKELREMESAPKDILDKNQNSSDDEEEDSGEFWQTQKSRGFYGHKRPAPIKGNKLNNGSLKTVSKDSVNLSWLFVSGLVPDTNTSEIEGYLKENGVMHCSVEKLLTKKQSVISSFKVGISMEDKTRVLDADFWPRDVLVNNFLNLKRVMTPYRGQRSQNQREMAQKGN